MKLVKAFTLSLIAIISLCSILSINKFNYLKVLINQVNNYEFENIFANESSNSSCQKNPNLPQCRRN